MLRFRIITLGFAYLLKLPANKITKTHKQTGPTSFDMKSVLSVLYSWLNGDGHR